MRRQRNFPKPMDVVYFSPDRSRLTKTFSRPPTLEEIYYSRPMADAIWALRPVNRTIVTKDGVKQYGLLRVFDISNLEMVSVGKLDPHMQAYRHMILEPRPHERLDFETLEAALAYIELMT